MIATEPKPTATAAAASDVCHVARTRDQALCGATLQIAEPWCCDDSSEPCGRPPCPDCNHRLPLGAPGAKD